MYVQPPAGEMPVQLPHEYHGTAFAPADEEAPVREAQKEEACAAPPEEEAREEAAPASARVRQGWREGLLSRFPLLSSLLPPARGEREHGELLTLLLLGVAVWLLLDDKSDDILPLLLLLLLWD